MFFQEISITVPWRIEIKNLSPRMATSVMLIRRPMFSVTRSGIRPPTLVAFSSGLIMAVNAAIAPETSMNGLFKAMKVTGSVNVGGVPPLPKPLSYSNGQPTLFQYLLAQKPPRAPETDPMDIPVNGASQFWAMFIAAPLADISGNLVLRVR